MTPINPSSPKRETCIVGIDPGLSGAIAFYFPAEPGLIAAEDVPIAGNEIDVSTLAARLEQMRPDVCFIERVNAMPKQGVASMFKFGMAFGMVRGVVAAAGIPMHLVTPPVWKKHFHLDSDKEKARALALRLWPASNCFTRKKDHGRAEASLLARYGAEIQIVRKP